MPKTDDTLRKTKRTTLKRRPNRGHFDRETVYSILDEALVCHVGFVSGGQPVVIPTLYGRDGDRLILHGSAASRMMKELAGGIDVCVTVTLVDGLVLARSAFHHSINYRSVVIFGTAREITGRDEKTAALRTLTEHVVPGRWDQVRPPNELEMKATTVLAMPIDEASAKIRTGDPVDDEEDYSIATWAGVLPLALSAGAPFDDGGLLEGVRIPANIREYRRGRQ